MVNLEHSASMLSYVEHISIQQLQVPYNVKYT